MSAELTSLLDIGTCVVAIAVGLLVIGFTVPSFKRHRDVVPLALFVFGITSYILSNAYWIAYSYMRPESRMPFAANEIGEIASYLLLAAVLNLMLSDLKANARIHIIITALFALGSIGLWILWTGEWIQDFLGGIPFGYYLCACTLGLKKTNGLTGNQWRIMCVLGFVAVLLNYIGCLMPKTMVWVIPSSSALLVLTLAGLFLKSIRIIKNNGDSRMQLALAVSCNAFSLAVMFLCEGYFYYIGNFFNIISIILIGIAINREVMEE